MKKKMKKKTASNNNIQENTSITIGDKTINTIVNSATSIAVQFQIDAPTFGEIWCTIHEKIEKKLCASTVVNYDIAFNRFEKIKDKPINTVTLHDLQPIFDEIMDSGAGRSKLANMKCVCNYIFDYALKYDYAFKRYPDYVEYEPTIGAVYVHKPFTNDEILKIYENGGLYCEVILVLIYTGLRPQELMNILPENVHLDAEYMIGGIKTESGKDRIIPLHPMIIPYVQHLLDRNKKYLYYNYCGKSAVSEFRQVVFYSAMDVLGMQHYLYDARHTFATLGMKYGLDDYAIKMIMGHKSNDLTKDVYTHADVEYLLKQIKKIPFPDKLDDAPDNIVKKIIKVIRGEL